MLKKVNVIIFGVIGIFAVIIIAGVIIKNSINAAGTGEEAGEESSSIFETVSNLEALELGLIDGDELREANGLEGASEDSILETLKTVKTYLSLRSIQEDITIKILDAETENVISGVLFTVTIKGTEKTFVYTDTDKDGIIHISYVDAGDYTVFLSDIISDKTEYICDKSAVISVSDSIQYAKVDIKDEIKQESDINAAEEDTKVQDVDETTDVSGSYSDVSESEDTEIYEDDISDDAEDILAQIEAETAAEEASKAAVSGASSGTILAPTILSDAQYVEAHSGSKGIDVSKHNGSIDWNAVKAAGINFAIIRCGYRGSSSGALIVDPYYYANIAGALAAGINVGVYFFSQAVSEAEAIEEASMVLELISGYSLQMPVYIDVEKSNGRGDAVSVDERTRIAYAFLATIENAGYTAGIYSNKLWFENMINTAALTNYKIWLAQYVDIPTYTATGYNMWQYTSKGIVNGISGYVDMNVLK